jgi:hypothetical protein
MQYSPKLKTAMEEIKAIMKKHDIGGWVILHTPGHSEFLNKLDPSYSCITITPDAKGDFVRFKSKIADYGGDKNAWLKKTTDSLNLLQSICETGSNTLLPIMDLTERLEKELNAERNIGGGFTSHTTQNN